MYVPHLIKIGQEMGAIVDTQKWTKPEVNWLLIDAHARLPLPVLLAVEHGFRCYTCDLRSKFEEDRIKSAVGIVDGHRDAHTERHTLKW